MNMNVCLILASTWIWWAVIVRPTALVCSSSLSMMEGGYNNNLNIDTVEFRVTGSTKKSYSAFLESLRTRLSSGTSMHGIPLLPTPSASGQNLVLVKLLYWDSDSITLVLDRTNAYVIAYEAQKRYYLLSDTPANPSLYGNDPHRLTFDGSYTDLQRVAKENRRNIDLGISELAQTITTLYYWSPPQVEKSVARSLIVLIQMVSETARFRTIEKRVVQTIVEKPPPIHYGNFRPGVGVMDLETNWGTLSTAVQQSINGVFKQAVKIKINETHTMDVLNVTDAQNFCGLALLLRLRTSTGFAAKPSIVLDLNIRSMLEIEA